MELQITENSCCFPLVTVIRDKITGFSRGFAYVVFRSHSSASLAQRVMDGQVSVCLGVKCLLSLVHIADFYW